MKVTDPTATYVRQNIRLYPNKEQTAYLRQELGNQDFLWNQLVAKNNQLYETEKKFLFRFDAEKFLIELKTIHPFLKLGNSQALQSVCKNFDTCLKEAIKNVKRPPKQKRKNAGFPTFKKSRNSRSANYPQNVTFDGSKMSIPKLKSTIRFRASKNIPAKFNSVTIKSSPDGRFHASLVIPVNQVTPVEITTNSPMVGIDLNAENFVVSSDGEFIKNPRHLLKVERRLKKYQKRHSRKVNGSKNRNKSRIKVARLHQKVANQRKDFVTKTAVQILKENDVVFIEDLNVKGMQKFNGRMVTHAPFGMFRATLTSKAKMLGKHVVSIGRFFPSSKTCSCCGERFPDLTLSTRWVICQSCGNSMDRDINAAMNILQEGQRILTAGTAGNNACGDNNLCTSELSDVQVGSPKQETTRSLA